MKKAIINYGGLSTANLLKVSGYIVTGMTGNANFPDSPFGAAAIKTQVDLVQTLSNASKTRDIETLSKLRDAKLVLTDMLRQTGDYVNSVAAGTETILITSGFRLSKEAEKGQLPAPIKQIKAEFTNISQTINLKWSSSKHAHYYNVFISADEGKSWTMFQTTIGRKLLVDALVSGQRYQFKVIPVGVKGQGEVSDIASQVAA